MSEDTIEHIHLKIAYLERATADLSDVVYRQQREIEALGLKLAALTSRLEEAQREEGASTPEQERPPHY